MFFNRKELESGVWVKEEFLYKKIQPEKGRLHEDRECRLWNSMEACEGYKVIEKFDKCLP